MPAWCVCGGGLLKPVLLSVEWAGQEGLSFSKAYPDALLQPKIRQSLAKHQDAHQGKVMERENKKVPLVQSLKSKGTVVDSRLALFLCVQHSSGNGLCAQGTEHMQRFRMQRSHTVIACFH